MLPSFNRNQCVTYFSSAFKAVFPNKIFTIPNWVPSLQAPVKPFNNIPPSYSKVTKVIRRMKSSGSPCPLDKIPILCFKRCAYLCSYLTEIIKVVWQSNNVPAAWKRACTILIHKRGDTNNPANFRPITLESIPLKVFTSCVRNKIFEFLTANNYIESNIQKGFVPKLSGTFEHTAQMGDIINTARLKQRSVIITLIDLKNAFEEVHHSLIPEVLCYHHVPEHIINIISSLYKDFRTTIITSKFRTPFIPVSKGVLQGDLFSPLMFNMCFNTFIQYIKAAKFKQFGFRAGLNVSPRHWFQFADDASIVTTNEKENQLLLNCFTRWCQWSHMIIRVDKCFTFGITKKSTRSHQCKPKLFINHEQIPPIETNESFIYLGRHFNYSMDDSKHKEELLNSLDDLIKVVDDLPLQPKNKLDLYHKYILPKLQWHLTVTNISKTWISENMDNVVSSYIRKWFEIPINGTLDNLVLSRKKFGLSLTLPTVKFMQCQTVLRNSLKNSPNKDIQELYRATSKGTNTQYDQFSTSKDVLKKVQSDKESRLAFELKSQGFLVTIMIKDSIKSTRTLWSNVQKLLPKNIYSFTLRYLNNTLATNKNKLLWKTSLSAACTYCAESESLLHVVSGCKVYLNEGRYNWRHDSVLLFLSKTFASVMDVRIYADLNGYDSPCIYTTDDDRPDLLVFYRNTVYVLELTVGFETNMLKNAERKNLRYTKLMRRFKIEYETVLFVNLSLGALGTISTHVNHL